MVRRAVLTVVLGAAPSTALAQAPPVPSAMPDTTVSIDRVSRALRTGRPLDIPPLPPPDHPTFRVDVRAPSGLETVLDRTRRELAENPLAGQPDSPLSGRPRPAVGVDVLPAIRGLVHRVQKARRERAARQAHADVTAELAAFCEVNDCAAPNEGLLLPHSW